MGKLEEKEIRGVWKNFWGVWPLETPMKKGGKKGKAPFEKKWCWLFALGKPLGTPFRPQEKENPFALGNHPPPILGPPLALLGPGPKKLNLLF